MKRDLPVMAPLTFNKHNCSQIVGLIPTLRSNRCFMNDDGTPNAMLEKIHKKELTTEDPVWEDLNEGCFAHPVAT